MTSATTSETGIVRGLFDAPGEVTTIVPEYVPGGSVIGLMPTTKVPGVAEDGGATLSQSSPESVDAAAVSTKPLEGTSLLIVRVWDAAVW